MSKVAKTTLGLMIITMLSKFMGFIRETVLVAIHGASAIADAYITAMNMPFVIFATIGAALGTTFIPLFFEIENNDGRENALNFSNNIFNIVIILSFLLALLGYVFAEPLTKLFAMKFEGETLKLATGFTRTIIWGMIFIGLSNIMTAWLQIKGKFFIAGIVGIPYNILIIIGIILSSNNNLKLLGIATLIGTASQLLIQLPSALKSGYKYRLYLNLKDKYLIKMMRLIVPVFIGVGVNQLNTVIDRSLAYTLGDGAFTILNSANKLNNFVLGLFTATIISVIYPNLSKLCNEEKRDNFVNTIKKSINSIVILIVPISVGAIVLAEPIVRIVFERGKFTQQDTKMTAIALSFYSIGMLAFSLRDILNKVFYSLKDTKTPMINGTISMIINIILNVILIKFMGYGGLAFATSLSAIICIILLLLSLKNKIEYFGQDKILITIIKCTISAVVMGIVTKISYEFISNIILEGMAYEIIGLLSAIVVGILVYLSMIMILKVEETYEIINLAKLKLNIEK